MKYLAVFDEHWLVSRFLSHHIITVVQELARTGDVSFPVRK